MTQGKATGIKICQFQFHTGFVAETETCLNFVKSELDELAEGQDHYQTKFVVSVSVFVSDVERKPSQPAPWYTDKTLRIMDTVFTSQIEKDETVDNFGKFERNLIKIISVYLGVIFITVSKPQMKPQRPPPPPPPSKPVDKPQRPPPPPTGPSSSPQPVRNIVNLEPEIEVRVKFVLNYIKSK